jgi:pyridoxine 5-phosphate synthase
VAPGEVTSQAGWQPGPQTSGLAGVVSTLKALGIRVSMFVDPEEAPIRWAASIGADRIELYTEPFARAYERGVEAARQSFATYADSARLAHSLSLGINAGHDLDLENLTIFRQLPHLDEVSIGHAIVSRAVFTGLETVLREYLAVLADA